MDACAADGAMGISHEVIQQCRNDVKNLRVGEAENKKCYRQAMIASGRTPEPDNKEAAEEMPVKESAFDRTVPARPAAAPPAEPRRETPPAAKKDPAKTETAAERRTRETDEGPTTRATPPNPTAFADTTDAEIQADQDIARCASEQSGANDCCNNPISCSDRLNSTDSRSLGALGGMLSNGPQSGGLTDYCRQMNSLGHNSGNVNNGLAAICAGSHNSCSNTCGDLARKYAALLDECDGCAAQSIYENARTSLMNNQSACSNLRTRSDQLALHGLGAANNAAVADYCGRVAGDPGGGLPGAGAAARPPNAPFINHLLAYNCNSNPDNPDCKVIQREERKGEVGFNSEAEARKKNADFNIPDPAQGFRGYNGNGSNPGTQAPIRNAGAGVPNNTGGPIAGHAGFAEPAKLPPKPTLAAAPGVNTEVENGFQGGNGYSQPVSNNGSNESGGGYAPMHSNSGTQFENLDLRQFLPGGSRAAGRRMASEINPKEENLFIRISNKMMEKCRLGVLWQCH